MIYKRILYTMFLAICAVMLNTTTIYAQGVSVKNATLEIDGKSAPALSATFEFSDEKDLIKSWKVYLKKQEKIKLGTKSGMLVDKEAGPNNISEKLQDVYSKVVTKDGISELYFTVSLGYSNYIDAISYPAEYQKIKSLFQNFATEYSTKYYTELLRERQSI